MRNLLRCVVTWIRPRWWLLLGGLAVLLGAVLLARSAFNDSEERRASRARIESSANEAKDLAREVRNQNVTLLALAEDLKQVLAGVNSATSQEARERSAATLAGAIADIRGSIYCTHLDDEEVYPACTEVAARLDAIRDGLDPFARPPTQGAP